MANFAKIGLNNKVLEVLHVHNNELKDSEGNEIEKIGVTFLTLLTGWSLWVQTSANTIAGKHTNNGTPMRKNYAGIGYTYDQDRDAFIPPKPYPSFTLNEDTCHWESPIAYPTTGGPYIWNETTLSWVVPE
jgi:hypothetical protein